MCAPNLPYLLVAQSARMPAQSAHRAGLNVAAIDHFADADTRRYAFRTATVPPESLEAQWLEAANRLAPKTQATGLIYSSGIDTRPGLVEALAHGRTLLGNTPAVLEQANNPRRFFALLSELGIPYPETRFAPPDRLDGWLLKAYCGEGGKGVGFAAKKRPAPAQSYYQQQIAGEALSVLFLANGKQARVVGFNTQWTDSRDPARPFLFAGAVNRAEISDAQRSRMTGHMENLSSALGLVGLNSLDFMLEDGACRVLELNPRPSATMALYDEDFSEGLLQAHIAACQGELPPQGEGRTPARAFRHVFAPRTLRVKENFAWPEGCADIPRPGTLIETGQPVCSLMAASKDKDALELMLKAREHELLTTCAHAG